MKFAFAASIVLAFCHARHLPERLLHYHKQVHRRNEFETFDLGALSNTQQIHASAEAPQCPAANGTTIQSAVGTSYLIACHTDYPKDDFIVQKAPDFPACLQKCDAMNLLHKRVVCLAAVFIRHTVDTLHECHLKGSIATSVSVNDTGVTAIRLPGSMLSATAASPNITISFSLNSGADPTTSSKVDFPETSIQITNYTAAITSHIATAEATSSSPDPGSSSGIIYAKGTNVIAPFPASSKLHGPSGNTPSKQYLAYKSPPSIKLDDSLLKVGVNGDLTTKYGMSLQTGVLDLNVSTQPLLQDLVDEPHLSRDGGQGGIVNGQHVFIFCDTGSYSKTTASRNGKFLGFVSSSVAIDVGMNGLNGKALDLQDGLGQWADKAGRMRGFSPMTEGEQAYNQVVQGNGQRYAVWPESSIIPLDTESGILFAPIVYDNVDRKTNQAIFTYTGATLLKVTAANKAGPRAERLVRKIFNQGEIEWGCAGGIRSWGLQGIGGNDGAVYIFGGVRGGLLLGRTTPANVADRDSFEFWNGQAWTPKILDASSKAFFISGSLMDSNLIYSPRHLTFIIVYITAYADSTFYYRYLKSDKPILPGFAPGGVRGSDYVENVLKYEWSEEKVLYKAAQGLNGHYIYAGAVHEGYYGSNDIVNGGSKMLLSWTAPTGQDPSSLNSEYQIVTAEISWQ